MSKWAHTEIADSVQERGTVDQPRVNVSAGMPGLQVPNIDKAGADQTRPQELGGPEGPEPTRFGDWERKGRCIDF